MGSKDLDRFLALLPTYEHRQGMRLFDGLAKDPANASPILEGLLFVVSNHDDPQLHTPHGLLTVHAAREALLLTRPPLGLGLLRFLVLYNFSLPKRALSPADAEARSRVVPPSDPLAMQDAYERAVAGSLGEPAAALLGRIALDHGPEAAARVVLRASFRDLGRLAHNLSLALAYADIAVRLGLPRGLVPLANLGRLQALHLAGSRSVEAPEPRPREDEAPDVARLAELVEGWEFDHVRGILDALALDGKADVAYRPLLIAASADPGFLGHNLSTVHAARLATRYLAPAENAWLLWKLYRTLTTRFGYPEFLRLGETTSMDHDSVLAAVELSLRHKSPSAETTVRHALEAGVPLDAVLERAVDFYGQWSVGEKEHTVSYLNAALQTARFLGREEALLPLAIALSKLPF